MCAFLSEHWEWALSVAAGTVAAGLAMLKYLLTRPKLEGRFDSCALSAGPVLGCNVVNVPRQWLNRVTAEGVTGRWAIEIPQSGQAVHRDHVHFEGNGPMDGPTDVVDIQANKKGVSIGLVQIYSGNGTVHVHATENRLYPGRYQVVIWLDEGADTRRFSRGLRVTADRPYAVWEQGDAGS